MKDKKSIIITGANSFLGREFASIFSKTDECKLLLTSRTKFDFGNILNRENVEYLPEIDLLNESNLNKFREFVKSYFHGKFHIINCLGYFPGCNLVEEVDIKEAKRVFDSNILTLYGIANKIIPLMCERGGGNFIGFSTHTSYQHFPKMVAFTAAKAAVESLIKGISNEYLEQGIIANTIALSTLYTKVELKIKPKGDSKNWLKPKEVCDLVDKLISQPFGLINGNVIHLYKYSDTYFHQSYFDRIKQNEK